MKALTLSYLTAIVSAALVAHTQAGGRGGGFGGGGHFGGFTGGGGGHFSAPSFRAAPSFVAPSFHAAPSFQAAPSFRAAPSVSFGGARAVAPAVRNFAVAPAPFRIMAPNVRNSGTQFNPRARLSSNWRGNTFVPGKDPRPSDGRSWDRDWRHNADWRHDRDWWPHHRHNRFFIDGGYLLGEPYYYPGYGDYSYEPSYYYDDSATTYSDATTNDSVVVDVQKELAREGYYRGSIDGILGSATRTAIAAYQRAHSLPVNGRINTQLIESLGLA
jgi:hypothetical protein